MKVLAVFIRTDHRSLPPMESSGGAGGDDAAGSPERGWSGRFHSLVTSRVTHAVLLLLAAVGNGLMLGALQYLHELTGPLAELTEALGNQAISSR